MLDMAPHGPTRDSSQPGEARLTNAMKHQILRKALLEIIASIDDGESLPPERALAEQLGVARMTVRNALDLLIREGRLRRIPGKGTFVTRSQALHASIGKPFAHPSVDGRSTAEAKALEVVQEDTGSRIGLRLQLAPSATVTKVVRVCFVDGEPVAVDRLFLPSHIFPNLTADHFSVFDVDEFYQADFGVRAARSSQVLRATTVDQAESMLLEVPVHSPAFFVTTTKTDTEDRVIEYSESIYRGDKYRFHKETSIDGDDDQPNVGAYRSHSNSHFIIS